MQSLKYFPQWVLWRIENGRKLPINPHTMGYASSTDSATWSTYDHCVSAAGSEHGVGFVFTAEDPFFFLDIDKCKNPDGSWSQLAVDICAMLPGAFMEISQSGSGLHIIGSTQPIKHRSKNIALGIELYTTERFVAITGTGAMGDASTDLTAPLAAVIERYFNPSQGGSAEWTHSPVPEAQPIADDGELIAKACKVRSGAAAFGARCSFNDLWLADEDALSQHYPDHSGNRTYDASSADAALAQHLAFWTGKDCDRILSLMWQSGLVRDKWNRDDYMERTILSACSSQSQVYTGGSKPSPAPQPTAHTSQPELISGFQYLSADAQLEHFKGCVYVQDSHRIFTPSGSMLKQEQFNAMYGGYVFQLDEMGDKTTRKAWEAFTESQAVRHPKAESVCFRPETPSGSILTEEGRRLVNTYVPINTERVAGDVSPFLSHLKLVLPDMADREIMLAYMAACVQHKGIKFQWCPLLQGVEGNGKTLFTRCVAFAVGSKYTHMPPANEINEKFNEWLFNKIFIGVEDVYVPDNKREIIEILKPMITNDRLAMRAMQQSQVMGDNRANFMLNSNHRDAIRKTRNDRRFAVFFSAQQQESDLKRDGMTGDYFPKLYEWLRNGGYAAVNELLHTYAIPDELNPATSCHRAPNTSSTNEAIQASRGSVEQEILEAIEEDRMGFAGGWVSSVALDRLLNDMRAGRMIPPNKRREMMQDLGYDWHPALKDGRANNPIGIDEGKKPKLFIRNGHVAVNISGAALVAEEYQKAQGVSVGATIVNKKAAR